MNKVGAGAIVAVAVFVGCSSDPASSSSGGASSSGGSGVAETWNGKFTGQILGPFICLAGTDGFYDEASTFTLQVPAPGLIALLSAPSTTFSGTFANTETAHENDGGMGCAPHPSVMSTTTAMTPITVTTKAGQITIASTTVLIPGGFKNAIGGSVNYAGKTFTLTPSAKTDAKITGGILSHSESSNPFNATFELTK